MARKQFDLYEKQKAKTAGASRVFASFQHCRHGQCELSSRRMYARAVRSVDCLFCVACVGQCAISRRRMLVPGFPWPASICFFTWQAWHANIHSDTHPSTHSLPYPPKITAPTLTSPILFRPDKLKIYKTFFIFIFFCVCTYFFFFDEINLLNESKKIQIFFRNIFPPLLWC